MTILFVLLNFFLFLLLGIIQFYLYLVPVLLSVDSASLILLFSAALDLHFSQLLS